MKIQSLLGTSLAAALLMVAGVSRASKPFPQELQDSLDPACAPQCTLCHIDNNGGPDTLKGFGVTIKERGGLMNPMAGAGLFTPAPSVAAARLKDFSTTGDAVSDYDKLTQGYDPNSSTNTSLCGGGPQYGCGAQAPVQPTPDDNNTMGLGALVFAGFAAALRRGRNQTRG